MTSSILTDLSEFTLGTDYFAKARKKGPKYWISRHIFAGSNQLLVISWLICVLFVNFLSSYIMILIGQTISHYASNDTAQASVLIIWVFVCGIGAPAISLLANLQREYLAQKMERDTRYEFYMNLLGKSQSFHDQQRIGDIMARASDDVRLMNFLISPALSLIIDSSFSVIVPIILIFLNYPIQFVIEPLLFSILFIKSLRTYMKNLGPATQQIRGEFGMMDAVLNETLTGIDLVKSMVKESFEKEKYLAHTQRYREGMLKEGYIQAKFLPLIMVALTTTAGLTHAILDHRAGGLELGEIIAYVGLLMNLRFPTFISIFAFSTVSQAVSAAERLLETMNLQTEIGQNSNGVQKIINGQIQFENVSFTYPQMVKPILKNISFEISPGQTIAIVGITGSGKTTLTKLLARLYDINQGRILIDQIPIANFSLQSLRSQIAFIEQDVFLFSTSIKDNIAFGRSATKEEIIAAAKDAQAHEFILNLPQQYETLLGEDGVQLSGGERQRIAIARAFLSNPKVLILDDSTSAIDSKTEEQIQNAIRRIVEKRTTLLITHRLSQIRWADKILVLRKGEIIAQGSHSELLQSCEEYRKIFVKRFDLPVEALLKGGK